jgi:hypothetical protein
MLKCKRCQTQQTSVFSKYKRRNPFVLVAGKNLVEWLLLAETGL